MLSPLDAAPGARPEVSISPPTLAQTLGRSVYSAVLWLLQPAVVVRLFWRSRAEPLYRHAIWQRFGLHGRERPASSETPRLWVHAVSLGETRAAEALIRSLRQECPSVSLVLTHGTATGWQAGSALLRPGDIQAWFPLDTPGAVQRFLDHFRPVAGVLLETEVWPNVLHHCHLRGIPMVLASARLNERSLRKGQRLACLIRPALQRLSLVLAQTEDDAKRLQAAGVDAQRMQVAGNLKFDMTPDSALLEQGQRFRDQLGRPIVLATSTREGEEPPLLRAWAAQSRQLAGPGPRPLLMLVPRHPQRFDEVARMIDAQGLRWVRKSEWAQTSVDLSKVEVCLGDSMGEMPFYYGMSAIALLGGSFAPLGGQNLIEAAACGCPIVMGPHTFNFAQAADGALAAGAAQRVGDIDAAVSIGLALSLSTTVSALSEKALAFAKKHRGASYCMARQIAPMLDSPRITP